MRGRGGRGRPRRDTGRGRLRRTQIEPVPPPLLQGEDVNLVVHPPLDDSSLVHPQQLGLRRTSTIRAGRRSSPPRTFPSSPTRNETRVQQDTSRRRGRPRRTINELTPPPHVHERTVRTRNSSNLDQGVSTSTPSIAPSIRDTARIQSVSSGSQQSQGSEQSYYNVRYSQINHRRHNDGDNDDDSDNTDEEELGRNNLDDSRINPRICICDRQLYPTDCRHCNVSSNITCDKHNHITCTHNQCEKKFHYECLRTGCSTNATLQELMEKYVCMECKCSVSAGNEDDTPWVSLPMDSNNPDILRERLCRVGITIPADVTNEQLRQSKRNLNKIVKAFEECNSPNTVLQHFANNPRPFPTPVDMHPDSIQQHVIHGRRAETSLLMYDVKRCNCCGSVKPGHNDPGFPKTGQAPFDRMHLVNSWHPAYLCTCSGVCQGSQFYAKDRPSIMTYYTHTHGGMKPDDCLNSDVSDAVICMKCYNEVTSQNKHGNKYANQTRIDS